MDSSDRMPGFAQFVPQLTYDLIARIVPGILLIAVASMFWGEKISSAGTLPLIDASQLWSLANVPGIVLIAYFGSQILETIWYRFVEPTIEYRYYKEMEGDVKRLVVADLRGAGHIKETSIEKLKFPGIALIYDTIRLKNPIAGSRIVKIRAEVQMYRNAFLGTLLIAAVLVFEKSVLDCSISQSIYALLGGCLFSITLFAQALYRRRRLVWSLYNHWILLVEPNFSKILDASD